MKKPYMRPAKFKAIRLRAGYTQAQLADRLRVTIKTVNNYENSARQISGPVSLLMEMLDADRMPFD